MLVLKVSGALHKSLLLWCDAVAPHAATWAAVLAHGLSDVPPAALAPPPALLLPLEYYGQFPSQVAQSGLLNSPVPSKLGCFLASEPLLLSLDIYDRQSN